MKKILRVKLLCIKFLFVKVDLCKTRANSSALLALLPANEAIHVPLPSVCTPLDKSWAHSFSAQSHWWNLSWKSAPAALDSHYISLPPNGALPKLFLTVSRPLTLSSLPSRSLPTKLSPNYFPGFPVRPPCLLWSVAPSILTELSPSYFPQFPVVSRGKGNYINENPSIGDAFGKNFGQLDATAPILAAKAEHFHSKPSTLSSPISDSCKMLQGKRHNRRCATVCVFAGCREIQWDPRFIISWCNLRFPKGHKANHFFRGSFWNVIWPVCVCKVSRKK